MANCFGSVVDNYKLDQSCGYLGKAKTKKDRAREAKKLKNEGGKNQSADSYVHGLKEEYGLGQTTLCLIFNATGGPLHYVDDHNWVGNLGRTPYPTVIGNGQWAAFLHAQSFADQAIRAIFPPGVAAELLFGSEGSDAGVVYRGTNEHGEERDILIAWRTPQAQLLRNKAYCEIGPVNSFHRWVGLYDKLRDSDYHSEDKRDGFEVIADTAKGNSPVFRAEIRIPVPSE